MVLYSLADAAHVTPGNRQTFPVRFSYENAAREACRVLDNGAEVAQAEAGLNRGLEFGKMRPTTV
jgi:hypothetical protein